ncbi:MAG: hypothetical protein JZD40_01815, partial [Sulfolobus sp.]|nr:hypothetical protein [Sulfolobus sp.]
LWKSAWKLHQDGFHEMVLEYNHVKIYSLKVKKLLEYIKHE